MRKKRRKNNKIVSLRLGVWKNVYYQHRGEVSILVRLFAFSSLSLTLGHPFPRSLACWNKRWARLWVCVAEIIPISFALSHSHAHTLPWYHTEISIFVMIKMVIIVKFMVDFFGVRTFAFFRPFSAPYLQHNESSRLFFFHSLCVCLCVLWRCNWNCILSCVISSLGQTYTSP